MADDTRIGGERDQFPATRLSALMAALSKDPVERQRGFEILVAAYWKPVYKYIRIKWGQSNEDSKDLTQGFFTQAMEKNFFQRYAPEKARFRTFLRICIDGFVLNEQKAAHRIKRGGDVVMLSLDFESAENELKNAEPPAVDAIDEYFEREWARSLFSLALDRLQAELQASGKEVYFRLFERYVLDDPDTSQNISYKDLSKEFGLSVSQVTNYLAFGRREFRRIILEKLRELTATEQEFRREARTLLGVDPE